LVRKTISFSKKRERLEKQLHREHYLFFTHDLSKISYLSCYHSFCSVKVTYAESLEPGSF